MQSPYGSSVGLENYDKLGGGEAPKRFLLERSASHFYRRTFMSSISRSQSLEVSNAKTSVQGLAIDFLKEGLGIGQ